MSIALTEALETYGFNDHMFDVILDDMVVIEAKAFEDTTIVGESAPATNTTTNNNTNNNNTNSNTNTDNSNSTNDPSKPETDQKKAQEEKGFLEKLKQVVQFIQDLIAKAVAKFKGKLSYMLAQKKDYEKEIRDLERVRKPRFDLVVKNRRYNPDFLAKVRNTSRDLFKEYENDIQQIIDKYKQVTENEEQKTAYNNEVAEISKKPLHQNTAKAFAEKLGSEFNQVESFAQLTKAIQQIFRGAKINLAENENEKNKIAGGDASEIKIDQNLYNMCKTKLLSAQQTFQIYDAHFKNMETTSKRLKDTTSVMTSGNGNGGDAAAVKAITKMVRGLNFFSTLGNFCVSLDVEFLSNARMVCMTALEAKMSQNPLNRKEKEQIKKENEVEDKIYGKKDKNGNRIVKLY